MWTDKGNADRDEVLNRQEYRNLQQQIMDTHRSLSDLERKLRYGKKHDYQLEGDVGNAIRALDQVRRTLEREFREY